MEFPTGRVVWRAHALAKDQLAAFPWVIITPVVVALLAAALAISLPSEAVKHGRVITPPFFDTVGPAAGGGVGAVAGLYALLWLYGYFRYLGWGDPIWASGVVEEGSSLAIEIGANVDPPPEVSNLHAIVRRPTGELYNPSTIMPDESPWFWIPQDWDSGEYEVRWYQRATKTIGPEIARRKFDLVDRHLANRKTYWVSG